MQRVRVGRHSLATHLTMLAGLSAPLLLVGRMKCPLQIDILTPSSAVLPLLLLLLRHPTWVASRGCDRLPQPPLVFHRRLLLRSAQGSLQVFVAATPAALPAAPAMPSTPALSPAVVMVPTSASASGSAPAHLPRVDLAPVDKHSHVAAAPSASTAEVEAAHAALHHLLHHTLHDLVHPNAHPRSSGHAATHERVQVLTHTAGAGEGGGGRGRLKRTGSVRGQALAHGRLRCRAHVPFRRLASLHPASSSYRRRLPRCPHRRRVACALARATRWLCIFRCTA